MPPVGASERPLPEEIPSCGVAPGFIASDSVKATVTSAGVPASLRIGSLGVTFNAVTAGPAASMSRLAPAPISVPRLPTASRAEKTA
jgi:hypothetical protein